MTVSVNRLSKSYGTGWAVHDISFSIEPGEIYGLLGANGAGKTTTLRMLSTLLQPTSGDAFVCGVSVQADPIQVRSKVGYLTGDTGLYDRLSPRELLTYFGELHGTRRTAIAKRIEWLAEGLGMGELLDRSCGTLSTGEKQRVNIGRALIHDPDVLIFDEATSGLDIVSSQFILEALREEKERGKTILVSTHILAEAELLCDRIGLIHSGRLHAEGTLDELLTKLEVPSLAEGMLRVARGEGS